MILTDSEKIFSQKFADARLFDQWRSNFFDVSALIKDEFPPDFHHRRWWYIALWELFESGSQYIENMLSLQENKDSLSLKNSLIYIKKLKDLFSESDYFMLQYYRHSASHIFQHNYSLLDRKGNLNPEDRKFSFRDKNDEKYTLTHEQILDKIKTVLGEYGLLESSYRTRLISRCFETIQQWSDSLTQIM